METPLVRPAAMPRVRDREDTRKDVGRRREEEGLDLREAKGLDDGREEVYGIQVNGHSFSSKQYAGFDRMRTHR